MRKYAILKEPFVLNDYGDMCVKIMLHETKSGVFIYLYTTTDEYQGNSFDYCFADWKNAEASASEWGVLESDWIALPDSLPDCFDSIAAPLL